MQKGFNREKTSETLLTRGANDSAELIPDCAVQDCASYDVIHKAPRTVNVSIDRTRTNNPHHSDRISNLKELHKSA